MFSTSYQQTQPNRSTFPGASLTQCIKLFTILIFSFFLAQYFLPQHPTIAQKSWNSLEIKAEKLNIFMISLAEYFLLAQPKKAITFPFGSEATADDDTTSQILPGPLPTETRNFPSGLHQTIKELIKISILSYKLFSSIQPQNVLNDDI